MIQKQNIFYSYVILSLSFFLTLFLTSNVFGADDPIHVEANKMTSTENTNSVLFVGDVDARQGDVRIRSDEMTVYYTRQEPEGSETKKKKKGSEEPKSAKQQVEKLVCVGNVEITRAEWLGTSKKMIYLSKERQVILIDDAKAWQDQNMVSGDKIIYYLDEKRSEVISKTRTQTTVGSKKDKKKGRVNMTILQN